MNFFNSTLGIRDPSLGRVSIVRVSYGRLGQLLSIKIKISCGDSDVDCRALEHVKSLPHPALHHPGKNKRRRLDQWYDIRYVEPISAL